MVEFSFKTSILKTIKPSCNGVVNIVHTAPEMLPPRMPCKRVIKDIDTERRRNADNVTDWVLYCYERSIGSAALPPGPVVI